MAKEPFRSAIAGKRCATTNGLLVQGGSREVNQRDADKPSTWRGEPFLIISESSPLARRMIAPFRLGEHEPYSATVEERQARILKKERNL